MEKRFVFYSKGGRPPKYETEAEKRQAKLESKKKWRNENKERVSAYNGYYRNNVQVTQQNSGDSVINKKVNISNKKKFSANAMQVKIKELQKIIKNDKIKNETTYKNCLDEIFIIMKPFLPHLVLIRGPHGSGKTTYAKNVYQNYEYVSADDYFLINGEYIFDCTKLGEAHSWCRKKTRELLSEKKNVVVANTFRTCWELSNYINSFNKIANVFILRITSQYENIHNVPKSIIDNYYAHYEPHKDEKYVEFDLLTKKIKTTNALK